MPVPYKHYKDEDVKKYGFEEVVRDQEILFKDHPTASGPNPKVDDLTYDQIPFPDTELVRKVVEFVKVCFISDMSRRVMLKGMQKELPVPTFNHSMRVYVWGMDLLHRTCFNPKSCSRLQAMLSGKPTFPSGLSILKRGSLPVCFTT